MRSLVSLVALAAAPLAAQQPVRQPLRGAEVAVYNLAGTLRVEGATGGGADVVVNITLAGPDASDLKVVTDPIDGRETLRVQYPGDEVVYPALGRGSRTELRVHEDGTFGGDRGRRGRGSRAVRIRGSGDGVEAWADLTVTVPRGKTVSVHLAVGEVVVSNVEGDLEVDVASANITATRTRGALRLDTGSGDITVTEASGAIDLDAGSGSIRATTIRGGPLRLDTGSGDVDVTDAEVTTLEIDTGSGDVTAERIGARTITIDTGSGAVELSLTADVDQLGIDTGSGDVTLTVPATLGAEVDIETSSGEIDLAFPIDVRRVERDRIQGRIGDGAGRISVETGSGDIRLIRS
jgi:DUF4097 and DUF4098 domain-containing protein YvlB